jgi:SSS family solute:Na+ symporter
MVTIALVSMTFSMEDDDPKSIHLTAATFKTNPVFNLCAYVIIIILAVLYALFW